MKKDFKNLFERMLITFVEGLFGYIIVMIATGGIESVDILKSTLAGAIAAGVSAAYNGVFKPFCKKRMDELAGMEAAPKDTGTIGDLYPDTTAESVKEASKLKRVGVPPERHPVAISNKDKSPEHDDEPAK